MSGAAQYVTEEQQNTLAIEISEIAWTCARSYGHGELRKDVAQTVVLDCLVLLRAEKWTTPHEFLVPHLRDRFKKTAANMRRGIRNRRQHQGVFLGRWGRSIHRGMTELLEIDANVLKELINRHLAQLPEAVARVVRMKYFENLTYKEIAAAAGISPGMVCKRLVEGVGKIREGIIAELTDRPSLPRDVSKQPEANRTAPAPLEVLGGISRTHAADLSESDIGSDGTDIVMTSTDGVDGWPRRYIPVAESVWH
jgi:RNA polymerase sigma factor (sigma-70 family)